MWLTQIGRGDGVVAEPRMGGRQRAKKTVAVTKTTKRSKPEQLEWRGCSQNVGRESVWGELGMPQLEEWRAGSICEGTGTGTDLAAWPTGPKQPRAELNAAVCTQFTQFPRVFSLRRHQGRVADLFAAVTRAARTRGSARTIPKRERERTNEREASDNVRARIGTRFRAPPERGTGTSGWPRAHVCGGRRRTDRRRRRFGGLQTETEVRWVCGALNPRLGQRGVGVPDVALEVASFGVSVPMGKFATRGLEWDGHVTRTAAVS